jgi:hypothetical protein
MGLCGVGRSPARRAAKLANAARRPEPWLGPAGRADRAKEKKAGGT